MRKRLLYGILYSVNLRDTNPLQDNIRTDKITKLLSG
jgi:hypothetical protein